MKAAKWGVLLLVNVLVTACQEESTPAIDLSGHWVVDHGFYQGCQVTASFTADKVIFSVYNLPEASCKTPLFGENVVIFDIDTRDDYFSDDGARATDLKIFRPQERIEATASLWETDSGLTVTLSALVDTTGQLDALLAQDYQLSLAAEGWLPDLLGRWGAPCDELYGGVAGEICEFIEFNDVTRGRGYVRGGTCTTNLPGGELDCVDNSGWEPFTYALNNVEQTDEHAYTLDIFLIMENEYSDTVPLVLNVSPGGLSLTFEGDQGLPETIELLPLANE